MSKIRDDNRKLMTEVDEFKASETAKRVTTAFEKSHDEINKVLEPKGAKDIGSLYTFLLASGNAD